ncbi:POTRA domain-containing protein [Flavihumibacter sp.]|uniref:POTRA domain-containing protein n=1 Tax=Flavihumibacter sp. TaxID=1913981 RepID=UPI002FC6478C|nr:hypothetical protein [Flavihumibacter sediminis]
MSMVWKYRTLLVAVICCTSCFVRSQSIIPSVAESGIAGNEEGVPINIENLPDSLKGRKPFVVSLISISGNKKTKDYVIKRELPFQEGDSVVLNELVEKFRLGKQQLINTRLFNEVVISLKRFRGYMVEVQVDVKERWYIFPIPYFKPVDRNLQTWAQKGYSLDRINYGAKFTYYNTTGRNDKLKLWLITGYAKQLQLSYDQPYADKSLKKGYAVNFIYSGLKEINVNTINNQQFFLKSDSLPKSGTFLETMYGGSVQFNYRPGLQTRHSLRAGYWVNEVDNAVLEINPKYLSLSGKKKIAVPELTYSISHVNVDYAPYPLKGVIADAAITRRGFGNDPGMWNLDLKGTRAWDLKKKFSYSLQFAGMLTLPFKQPYRNHRLFGYGDFYLRGLEKYVIDGVAGAMARNTLRREIFNFNVRLPVKKGSHDHIPFRLYAKTYTDMGFSINKTFDNNSYANRMLYTAGAGLDIVTLYDIVVRLEYSANHFGQRGFFFHFKNDF